MTGRRQTRTFSIFQDAFWCITWLGNVGATAAAVTSAADVLSGTPAFVMAPALAAIAALVYTVTPAVLARTLRLTPVAGRAPVLSRQWIRWRLGWMLWAHVYFFLARPVITIKAWRTLVFRLHGARVAYSAILAPNVDIQDVNALLRIGPGCTVGAGAVLSCHMSVGGMTILQPITLESAAFVGGASVIGPGVTIGSGAVLQYGVGCSYGVTIGAASVIGSSTAIGANTSIGAGATVGDRCVIGRDVVIPPGTVVPDGTVIDDRCTVDGGEQVAAVTAPAAAVADTKRTPTSTGGG